MRYDRQIILPEIGEEGQKKLQEAKVLIVGVGGLGSPIALYLAGAGVGCLGLVDDDLVSITNLQRQVLYSEKELGKPKAICAATACHKRFEACYRDNLHSIWAGQELYRKGNSREVFYNILERNMMPVYDSARRQGYEIWNYR